MLRVGKRILVATLVLALVLASAGIGALAAGIAYGDKGDTVRAMQSRLAELGFFSGEVDGIFGDETRTAVQNFQIANGMSSTGDADASTLERMRSDEAISKDAYLEALVEQARLAETQIVVQSGDEGDVVKQVQNRLIELGYAVGEASGRYGSATMESVSTFQKLAGLTVSGAVNVETYNALFDDSALTLEEALLHGAIAAQNSQVQYLANGDTGRNVEILQEYLCEYGYYTGEVDGIFGDELENAVRLFQRQNALAETGKVDTVMRDLLVSGEVAYESSYQAYLSALPVRFGDSGASVRLLQMRLKELGYLSGSIDGKFGTATQTAVALFQKAHGMDATGEADEATRAQMNSSNAISYLQARSQGGFLPPIQYGDSGDEVALLQQALFALGYYGDSIDGIFGAGMLAAVKAFQTANSMEVTGVVDEATRVAIFSPLAVGRDEYLASVDAAEGTSAGALTAGISTRDSCVEFVCRMALEKIGAAYASSAAGPDEFDSSGFTYYLYGLAGVILPRSTEGQGYMSTARVTLDALERGDIVCFDTETDDDLSDHVGLYLGDGQFIHASASTGKVVISSMSDGYYAGAFSWGIRPLQ